MKKNVVSRGLQSNIALVNTTAKERSNVSLCRFHDYHRFKSGLASAPALR